MAMGQCWENLRKLRPLLYLLLPLCAHWIAEEMIVSVLVDITTNALCPDRKSCPHAIYINGLQRTVVGIFKMLVLPLLGRLADEYGRTRKPLLILIVLTNIIPFVLLAVDQSKGSVYAYYVLRTISYITSQGSIFCISFAYAADVMDDSNGPFSASQVRKNILARFLQNNDVFEADVEDDSSGITGLFSAAQFIGDVLARFIPKDYIFVVSIALLVFVPVYMTVFLTETVRPTRKADQHIPFLNKAFNAVHEQYYSMKHDICYTLILRGIDYLITVYLFNQVGYFWSLSLGPAH